MGAVDYLNINVRRGFTDGRGGGGQLDDIEMDLSAQAIKEGWVWFGVRQDSHLGRAVNIRK